MYKPPSRPFGLLFIAGGAALGILLAWLLPVSGAALRASTASPAGPTLSPAVPQKVWALPTRSLPTQTAGRGVVRAGAPAPDFALEDRDGNLVRLQGLRGSVVVINFWASWCPPCREEMPDLQQLAGTYPDGELVVLGVNTTYVDNRAAALKFIDELGLTFPILFDESGTVSERLYSVYGLPTSYWIDQEGSVYQVNVGAMTGSQMADAADALLREKE